MTDVPHRQKALPLAQSILWSPGGAPPGDTGPYAVFMHQRALNALHEHLKSSPDKGVLGFLLGHLYEDPQSQHKFGVIELVMRLTVAIYGDKTTVVVSRVWDKMQEELTRSGAQLLGWYHSHPPDGVELAQGDLETHATYFGDVWQSALVIGMGPEGPIAGLYRPRGDGSDAGIPLPFFELLDPRSVTPDGKKRSSVRWGNYKPHRPPANISVARSGPVPAVPDATAGPLSFKPSAPPAPEKPKAAPPPPPPPPPPAPPPPPPPPTPPLTTLTVPRPPQAQRPLAADMVPPGDTSAMIRVDKPPSPPPVTPEPARRRPSRAQRRFLLSERPRRGRRVGVVLILLLLLGGGGAAAWYFLLGPGAAAAPEVSGATSPAQPATVPDSVPPAPAPPIDNVPAAPSPELIPSGPPPATPPPAAGAIDRLSDTLVTAIRAYEERSRLYDGGLADCTVLARGLVAVEGAWTRYEAEKRQLTAQLDATRTQRDLHLFSSVDSASAHYDRSGCRRP